MEWGIVTIYVSMGLLTNLLMEDSIRRSEPKYPVSARVLTGVFWPLTVLLLIVAFIYYWRHLE